MIKINNKEKIYLVSLVFIVSFVSSILLIDIEAIKFDVDRFGLVGIVEYFFKVYLYLLFMPAVIPILMIKNIDANSSILYIWITIVLSIVVPIIIYLIYLIIKKREFTTIKIKLLNYVILFICFELWFLLGLVAAGMERI